MNKVKIKVSDVIKLIFVSLVLAKGLAWPTLYSCKAITNSEHFSLFCQVTRHCVDVVQGLIHD